MTDGSPANRNDAPAIPVIVGRSSSHHTRVVRIFALELGVECSFRIVRDLMSRVPSDFGGNPALKLPALESSEGVWFGTLNICRELSRLSRTQGRVVWPEESDCAVVANAHELVMSGMVSEVSLIVSTLAGHSEDDAHRAKLETSLVNTLAWLEQNAGEALARLPQERARSYLEVALFCFVTHLEFRNVVPTNPYPQLRRFCSEFGMRASARETEYRFDA
jgi:glutathione S-transferase